MNFEVMRASVDQQQVLANLLELYQHDFTEFDDNEVRDDGRFGYDCLPEYWRDERRHPFLIRADGHWAGVALVRRQSHFSGDEDIADMTEFFVMRKYRRHGIGTAAAHQVFALFPGRWEVRVMAANTPAQPFWRRTIDEYTAGAFGERWSDDEKWKGLVLSFTSPWQTPHQ